MPSIRKSTAYLSSRGIRNIKTLTHFFPEFELSNHASICDHILLWGRKPSGISGLKTAKKFGLKPIFIEDGYLRSVQGGADDPPLSLIVDDIGIYYDSNVPSRLEKHLAVGLSSTEKLRTTKLIDLWRTHRVSKYNYLPEGNDKLPDDYILVVDQTLGDASIKYGQANAQSFQCMLDAALATFPDTTILLKIHPDVWAGRKTGHFNIEKLKSNPRIVVLATDVHPVRLIEFATAIYVVTSQVGFEGLLWGKPVYTFGMPFYAGYGLTNDFLPASSRRQAIELEQLVYAVLVRYPRYIHPETSSRCEVEDLIQWMGLQRRMRNRFVGTIYAPGFSSWKRNILSAFFQGTSLKFPANLADVPHGADIAVWGNQRLGLMHSSSVIHLEDGFLRSVGLGADLTRPLSWVMDRSGIYYDATSSSDLEKLLLHTEFDDELRKRAENLCTKVVSENLTKYNEAAGGWARPKGIGQVILVPGQVESDASIQFGSPELKSNLELLKAVRNANPEAYIIYKPHPDVLAGLRQAGLSEYGVTSWCDEIVTNCSMGALLQSVDEVHVLTSLAGFEALLREKKVVTYGQPFYSGWGLTHDIFPISRRQRQLSLFELVAGALILYPVYVSYKTGKFTTPENALEELLLLKRSFKAVSIWRSAQRLLLRVINRAREKV